MSPRRLAALAALAAPLAAAPAASAEAPVVTSIATGAGSGLNNGGQFALCPGVESTLRAITTNTPTSFAWTTPGAPTSEQVPIVGGRPTSYAVTASNADGTSPSFSFSVGVPAPQVLNAFTNMPAPRRRQTVTLTGGGSHPAGCPLTLEWDFDQDGAFDDATGPSVNYTPPNAATVDIIRVRARDLAGPGDERSITLNVRPNEPPTARAAAARSSLLLGESTTLTASQVADIDGDIATVAWDLDGNGTSDVSGETVTLTATAGGQRPALRVTDDLGGVTVVPVGVTTFGLPSLGISPGVVTGTYSSAGRALTNEQRDGLRQTGKLDGVELTVPIAVANLRDVRTSLLVPGKLAKRLGLGGDGVAPVEIATGQTSSSFGFSGGPVGVAVTPTMAGSRVFARIRKLEVIVRVASTDGFGAPLGGDFPATLSEDKRRVTSSTSGRRPRAKVRSAVRLKIRGARVSRR